MGMNRKWNMRVFELHDSDKDNIAPVSETDTNKDVYVDTAVTTISMQKYPFSASAVFGDDVDDEDVLTIDIKDLTADADFNANITDKSNWFFKEGHTGNIQIAEENGDTILNFISVVTGIYDMPTETTRWVLQFDLKTDPRLYRNFIFFDGVDEHEVRYGYGMDIPSVSYPHLDRIISIEGAAHQSEGIENTYADEQYFTGADYMSVTICRWDNIYTLYYDNRYMITVPTEETSINRFGVWTWSSSHTLIKNPQLFIIDNDADTTYVMITDSTNATS